MGWRLDVGAAEDAGAHQELERFDDLDFGEDGAGGELHQVAGFGAGDVDTPLGGADADRLAGNRAGPLEAGLAGGDGLGGTGLGFAPTGPFEHGAVG